MVPNLWSPVKFVYDKHAYWGTSHWGPKRQRFYGFASNRKSKHDVDSRKRIIAVTSLKIMKWYDYSHLEVIEVRREDQQLYKFKEGDFPRLRLQDIEDMLLLLEGGRSSIRCQKLPKEAQPHQTRHIQARSQEKNRIHCIFRPSRSDIHGSEQQKQIDSIRVIPRSTHNDDGNPSRANIKQALRIKVKEFQRSFCHSDIERLSRSDEVLQLNNFKKDVLFKLSRPRNNNSMSMLVQKSQVNKPATRSQDDDKRLCLVDDLKEV
ncbi:hypothetical protein Tco_0190511 [Tanacetum coccineum]